MTPSKKHKLQTAMNGFYSYNDSGSFAGTALTTTIDVPFATVEFIGLQMVQSAAAVADPPLEVIATINADGRISATPKSSGGYQLTIGRQSSGTSGLQFMYHAEGR